MEKRNQLLKFSILILTFRNCLEKSEVSEKSIRKALNDEDDPLNSLDAEEDVVASLKVDIEIMKEKFHENYGMTTEELKDIDLETSVASASSDAEIIAEVPGHVDINNEKESSDEEQPTHCISKPSLKNAMNAITVLEDYSWFSNFGADLMNVLRNVHLAFDLDYLSNEKQSIFKDFFQTL